MVATLVSYRIHADNPGYGKLEQHLTGLSKHPPAHPFDNTWIIESDLDATSVKKSFVEQFTFDSTDQLLITRVTDLQKDPVYDELHIHEKARSILEHKDTSFVRFAPVNGRDLYETEKQIVFFVSCDHAEKDTEQIDTQLGKWADKHQRVTTSTWILLRKQDAFSDTYFDKLCALVIRIGGEGFKGLVAQLTCGFPGAKEPLVHPLGAVDPKLSLIHI